ncbi:signal recognition particle-docking protein FtsY [Geoalkalibacter ferrihydriticus]|uniref:Signal recognition particle receptor FtsY n=1 Tax=Geoalkalibacter ferrihydriticus TaxID=392333 RepID=A0A1G9JJ31_9BACT|nr:signal recognition particle-docking protein FtsY [Geoalkalibacter ferrihydriticus]SDL37104.1 signal recognition particle-docking protein FtsY [Geoalkalibacter ferrihydriticus]
MEWFEQVLETIALLLTDLGVPEAYLDLGALGLVYVTAIVIVLLFILLLLRIVRKRGRKPAEELPEEEGEADSVSAQEAQVPEVLQEQTVAEEEEEVSVVSETPPLEEPPAEQVPDEEPVRPAPPAPPPVVEVEAPPVSLFERMRQGLAKTQASLVGRIDTLLRGSKTIDADLFEELEEILITADLGMKTTQDLVSALQARLDRNELADMDALRRALQEELTQRMRLKAAPIDLAAATPFVIMVVGVNGVGKTTTIGKLARQFKGQGKKVVLGAGDTFRAAAAEQLCIWGERSGVEVVRHKEGADPAAVAFDAAKAALARKADVLILDTAGRLHTKANLMEELKKVRRVLGREIPGAPHETLLVLDATTGQNALTQARQFNEVVSISGIALTKLDGTAKGGIVVSIGNELGLPVRYVGIGEGVEDLRPFDPEMFVAALFKKEGNHLES